MKIFTLTLITAFMLVAITACGGGDAGMGDSPAKESASQHLFLK